MVVKLALSKKSYNSAKVSVFKGNLYGEEKIRSFLDYSYEEILKYMEEHNFKDSIDESYFKYEGFYLIEKVLNDHLSKLYDKIIASSSGNNKLFLEEYYLKYQIHNLMVIIRCRLSEEKDFEAYLIGDYRKKSKFVKAFEMANIEDSITYISKKLKFNSEKVLEKYNEGIFELENYLYKKYYDRLMNYKFSFNSRDEREFTKFIRKYVDLINARSFGKLLSETEEKIKFSEVYISGGNLGLDFFNSMKGFSKEKYIETISKKFRSTSSVEEFSSLVSLDKEIGLHKKKSSIMFRKVKFGSPFYSLKFLFEAEREMAMLRSLLKAKYLGLERDEIERLI